VSDVRPGSRSSRAAHRRRTIILASVVAAVVLIATIVIFVVLSPLEQEVAVPSPSRSTTPPPTPSATPTPTPTPTFDRAAQSIDDPASYWVVVNKTRPLAPADYEASDLVSVPVPFANPAILRQDAADAVVAMFAAFTAESGGLQMQMQSSYRSYSRQQVVYQGWVDQLGAAAADGTSARPGYSEHQTGLATDISALPANCTLEACFADTAQGQWLAANSWRFGFIIRYPIDLTSTTGYIYEPWHIRYVGLDLAAEMHETGIQTLEEFFGLPAAPDYL